MFVVWLGVHGVVCVGTWLDLWWFVVRIWVIRGDCGWRRVRFTSMWCSSWVRSFGALCHSFSELCRMCVRYLVVCSSADPRFHSHFRLHPLELRFLEGPPGRGAVPRPVQGPDRDEVKRRYCGFSFSLTGFCFPFFGFEFLKIHGELACEGEKNITRACFGIFTCNATVRNVRRAGWFVVVVWVVCGDSWWFAAACLLVVGGLWCLIIVGGLWRFFGDFWWSSTFTWWFA